MKDWGLTEGEGAPAKVKVNAKEKEKGPDTAGGSVSTNSVSPAHPIDDNVGPHGEMNGNKAGPHEEVLRSGVELPSTDEDGRYKDVMQKAQREYEDLELIAGVPVSQVGAGFAVRVKLKRGIGLDV